MSISEAKPGRRIVRLEACRGIAAMVVIAHHTTQAFAPGTEHWIANSPIRMVVNGIGAVAFFFVLSGYVLTAKFFASPNAQAMATAIIKRLPRLALLTTIATVTSALLWSFGLYYFHDAALISGSGWLATFGGMSSDFQPTLVGAIREGVWSTFLIGDANYDSSLWTMTHEFHGSLLVFVLAPTVVLLFNSRSAWFAMLTAAVVFHYANNLMMFFIAGMAIARYEPQLRAIVRPWLNFALFVSALVLLSITLASDQAVSTKVSLCWLAGASCMVIAVLTSSLAESLLDNKVGWLLGFLSFPIYVMHVPVICSIGSWVFIATNGHFASAALATVFVTFAVSLPLAHLDSAWVRYLNRRFATSMTLKSA
jgi:peptidoglycan/LPS O-acetylase OafA/YrhL